MKVNKKTKDSSFQRILWPALVLLFLSGSLPAQTKLRNALDFDGDGKADYSITRTDGTNFYWFNYLSGTGSLGSGNFGIGNTDTVTPGDYDGDGKADLAVYRQTGYWYRLNSSNNTFAAAAWGINGDEPIARDYDGDGKTDLAVVRRTSTTMTWWILQSSNSTAKGVQWGLNTDMAVPGDYDGDGKFDVAVYRPGSTSSAGSNYYIVRSSDGGIGYGSWGLGGDWAVPGDYDGDGKTDLAVVRRLSPTSDSGLEYWYILKSSDGTLLAYSFGNTETDTPIQNDYDGDGKTDVAVWRETDAGFIVQRSSDLSTTVTNWGLISDYPVASYDTH